MAFRKKKDSSVHVAAQLVRNGQADAMVSAGNTGAVMTVGAVYAGHAAFGGPAGAGGAVSHARAAFR